MLILGIDGLSASSELALRWLSLDLTDDKATNSLPEPMLTQFYVTMQYH